MFDLLPNLIASLISILLPTFASYKALRSSDPAVLSPWLMYWVTFGLLTLLETHLWPLTYLIPFYAYLRIFVLLYLVLPQTQGARHIYQTRIHPFLAHHEARIETAIGEAHERLRAWGLDWVREVLRVVRARVLGEERAGMGVGGRAEAEAYPRGTQGVQGAQGYAAALLQRFSLPAASAGLAAPAGDFYGLLSAAAATLGRGAQGAEVADPAQQVERLLRSGGLVPAGVNTREEKQRFLGTQREKLSVLLSALEKEEGRLEGEGAGAGEMGRSKSEVSFERIEGEDLAYGAPPVREAKGAAEGWLGGWFGGGKGAEKKKEE